MFERTYAGLDIHARSVVGAAVDGVSGEIRLLRLAPQTEAVWGHRADGRRSGTAGRR